MKKFLPLVLVITLSITFFACGARDDGSFTPTPTVPALDMKYMPDAVALSDEIKQITNISITDDGTVFFLAHITADGGESIIPYSMPFLGADGGAPAALSDYTAPEPDNDGGKLCAAALCAVGNDIWIAERSEHTSASEKTFVYLRKLDSSGAELISLDISDELFTRDGQSANIDGLAIDADGNFYIYGEFYGVNVLDRDGKRLFSLPNSTGKYTSKLLSRSDGSIAAFILNAEDMSAAVTAIDTRASGWGDVIETMTYAQTVYSAGVGSYDFLLGELEGLFGYAAEPNKLFNWVDAKVAFESVTSLGFLPDGRIVCAANVNGKAQLCVLTLREAEAPPEKIKLKVATFGRQAPVEREVFFFNSENNEYEIELVQYSDGITGLTYSYTTAAFFTTFSSIMVSSNAPDIIVVPAQFPLDNYFAKGAFEDLYPYLDNDTELGGREAFVPSVLSAIETGDKLYQVAPYFSIDSALALSDIVGNRESWTIDEMLELLGDDMQIFANQSAEQILNFMLFNNLDSFIDWSTGKSHFDSSEFIALLELCATMPSNPGSERGGIVPFEEMEALGREIVYAQRQFREGRVLAEPTKLLNFVSHLAKKEDYGENITYIGYPTSSGSGSTFAFNTMLLMSSQSEHTDKAWEYIRRFLTEEYQTPPDVSMYASFPTNRAALDNVAEMTMTKVMGINEHGEEVEIPREFIVSSFYAATQDEIDTIMRIIESMNKRTKNELSVSNIVYEETQPYFAGQRSVEDAVRIIQSRVSIYISEQR